MRGVLQKCDPGMEQPAQGATACLACPLGAFSASAGAGVCLGCPAGMHAPVPGASNCASCAAGRFAADVSSTTCGLCDAGSYGDAAGMVWRLTFVKFERAVLQSACVSCPPNGVAPNQGQTFCELCTQDSVNVDQKCSCAAGLVATSLPGAAVIHCQPCPHGARCDTAGVTLTNMPRNPAGGSCAQPTTLFRSSCPACMCPTARRARRHRTASSTGTDVSFYTPEKKVNLSCPLVALCALCKVTRCAGLFTV